MHSMFGHQRVKTRDGLTFAHCLKPVTSRISVTFSDTVIIERPHVRHHVMGITDKRNTIQNIFIPDFFYLSFFRFGFKHFLQ